MQVQVKDLKGADVEMIEIADAVFGVAMHPAVVHQALVRQRANSRQGTHDTKTRSEVSGSGKKPWPQKHTGRARAGDKRSPVWRHGGIVFGPHPRDYSQDMPRKMRRLAIRCLLSDKLAGGNLVVVQNLDFAEGGKTKEMANLLKALNIQDTALIVTPQAHAAVIKAAGNLPRVRTLPAPQINVGDLLKYRHLIITVDAIRKAEDLWSKGIDRKRGGIPAELAEATGSEERDAA